MGADARMVGDLGVAHPLEPGEQEHVAGHRVEAVQHPKKIPALIAVVNDLRHGRRLYNFLRGIIVEGLVIFNMAVPAPHSIAPPFVFQQVGGDLEQIKLGPRQLRRILKAGEPHVKILGQILRRASVAGRRPEITVKRAMIFAYDTAEDRAPLVLRGGLV